VLFVAIRAMAPPGHAALKAMRRNGFPKIAPVGHQQTALVASDSNRVARFARPQPLSSRPT
jgi:hypothetical protein